ncbi:tetratricopeptide repeat protein [Pseudoalteromonas tunicata]|jgi:Flp pilus assembly protein TadD|uniref:Putative orphan protein putative TPR domain protein n=1 Tax=Pseudoalteromonas tunicata D2 TaxID=87626 RepID=A4CD45_9GAMM|nr:tetratricopeptide repeat protein [Pseudoalteromonas tunicata]ATC93995.1 hypothetical protein PTUN_a1357 [Pseudoalteromonas tunicata]AXT29779.1 tetratricopeptide repeat protein [Pseudoalteromonas tunicata]EAR27488.1 putative orphan protein; putative TPR domain protein [Pseudoalteromonas tunicata D2]MDP4982793.1 tetratricopeptide repeat protein [Pseudoalteromonas tunicata]MDP5213728.1 tetratricopeptide repeat protein [Pseudoalteromonas tunicata]
MKYHLIISLLTVLLLSGCQTTSTPSIPQHPFELVNQPSFKVLTVESQAEIFRLDNTIITKLNKSISHSNDAKLITKELLQFIFNSAENQINYRSGSTLTANQTFSQQNANCLSLSILSYALASELQLRSAFQRVHIPEYWSLEQGVNMLTGHVNLKIDFESFDRLNGVNRYYNYADSVTIDFDPNTRQQPFKTEFISKEVITAMFYNNKGAMAMINQQYDLAFSYFKAAIELIPSYSGSWGNLGILLKINQLTHDAELAYLHAIKLDDNNNTAKGNLAILYNQTGREMLARSIEQQLLEKRKENPFYHLAIGNEAFLHREYRQAINHYRNALNLDKNNHESYFGLAKSYFELGDKKLATRYLKKAHKNAQFSADLERYQNKLSHLNALVQY